MRTHLRAWVAAPAACATAVAAVAIAPVAAASPGSVAAVADGDGCYVHLFDGDDFDANDDNFTLTEPGEYSDLKDLPGASKDWTDEADSIKVGSAATVEIYADVDFGGQHQTLESASEHSAVATEPSSLTLTCDGKDQEPFDDVSSDSVFYDAIMWMNSENIANGYGDGTFRPAAAVTRQAVAAFLYRMSEGHDATAGCDEAPFDDVAVDDAFCAAISWMQDQNITSGFVDGTFRPAAAVTRQAAAAFLYRLSHGGAQAPACTAKPFPDVAVGSAFCGAITWLAAKDITKGYDDGTFRPGVDVSREAMAAYLKRMTDG